MNKIYCHTRAGFSLAHAALFDDPNIRGNSTGYWDVGYSDRIFVFEDEQMYKRAIEKLNALNIGFDVKMNENL